LIISFSSLLTFFAGGAFVPTIAVVAKDLDVGQEDVHWTVAIYLFVSGLGGLVWGRYSGYYGRRPIYLLALAIYVVGSLGVAFSSDLCSLAVTRSIQGFGTACFLSTGAATVSDIFKLEERGRAMGVYSSIMLVGPAIAPFIGGLVSQSLSWRWMQVILAIGALIAFGLVAKWLPETIHPGMAGCDIEAKLSLSPRKGLVMLNPFTSLKLLLSPVLLISTTVGAVSLITDYFLLVPLSHVFHEYYDIDNEIIIGAVFLPSGVGNMIGALLAGWLSDYYIIQGERTRGGVWLPEDRLKAVIPAIAIFTPLSVLGYGLTTEFIRGNAGILLNCFWLFLNGVGVANVIGPCNVYGIDIFMTRNAEVSAVANSLRQFSISGASGVSLSLIKTIGMAQSGAALAVLCWISYSALLLNIRYGKKLRDWKDMGYTLRSH